MAQFLLIVGAWILLQTIARRIDRKADRQNELESLKRERKLSEFWGFNTEGDDKRYQQKLMEKENWKEKLKFVCYCVLGGLVFATGAMIWFNEDKSHTWDMAYTFLGSCVVGIFLLWNWYKMTKKVDKLSVEINELNHMLKVVKDHAEGDASDIAKRVAALERKR
jgi:hypothetical protein